MANVVEIYIAIIILFIVLIVILTVALNPDDNSPMESIPEDSFTFPVYIINLDRKPERYEYVKNQLDSMGITGYHRWKATDGFNTGSNELVKNGVTTKLAERRGLAGCASSHIRLWRHIAENKMGWTLILEDDAHFHPQFVSLFHKYWRHIPKTAKIVFPGYCGSSDLEKPNDITSEAGVMCLHGYMLSWQGAQYLLDNLIPIDIPIDIVVDDHFKRFKGSYIFNGNATMD